MELNLNKPVKHVPDTIKRVYGHGFTATIDHVHKTIRVEFTRVQVEVFLSATQVVERFIEKGYDNID